jgi:hypothetical protein
MVAEAQQLLKRLHALDYGATGGGGGVPSASPSAAEQTVPRESVSFSLLCPLLEPQCRAQRS